MKMEDAVVLRQLLAAQLERTLESNLNDWLHNLRYNGSQVKKSVWEIPVSKAKTCLIFGPGASLRKWENRIHELHDSGYIVATPSVLPWMIRHDIVPDLVVAVDKSKKMQDWIELAEWDGPVAASTYADPSLGQNNTYWFNISILPMKDGLWQTPLDDIVSGMMDDIPTFPSLACVTNMALYLMVGLVFKKLAKFERYILVGTDYGFWKDLERVPIVGDKYANAPSESVVKIDGVLTEYKMALYAERLYTFLAAESPKIYSMSEGILKDIPYMSLDDILAKKYPSQPNWNNVHERYFMEVLPAIIPHVTEHE